MAIDTPFDVGDAVSAISFTITGTVVGIHKDRHGVVRLDVEYRDRRGKRRTEWFEPGQLEPAR